MNKDAINIHMGFHGSSVVKEYACNSGDSGSIPGSRRSPGEGIGYPLPAFLGFPGGSDGKESSCNAKGLGLIPGLGKFPGEGKGYPLQHSYLDNSMDKGTWRVTVHGVAKSRT